MAEVIQQIGAYAGLAAIVGLAVLSALYFSQARDLRRLREWAGRAPDRPEGADARAGGERERARVAAPQEGRSGTGVVGGPGSATSPPAPAQASAGGAGGVAAASGAGGATAAPPSPVSAPSSNGPSAPATADAPAQADPRPGVRPPAPASGFGGQPASRTSAPVRPSGARSNGRSPERPPERSTLPYAILAVVGLLIVIGAGAFAVGLLGGREEPEPTAQQVPAGQAPGGSTQTAADPSAITFSVLNGTGVDGLAKQVADELEAAGYRRGNVTNATAQMAETVILYAPGARADAQAVARELDVSQTEAADPRSRSLAGDATVIVVAGADQTR